jgi:hypothetical protein
VEREGALALSDERLALDGHQPLGAALAFWRRIDGSGDEGADFGLEDLLDVPVRYLSTGQRKRAALARVAASQAAIWLLDEPLNGLDTQWAAVAQERIAAHLAGGGAVVIACTSRSRSPGCDSWRCGITSHDRASLADLHARSGAAAARRAGGGAGRCCRCCSSSRWPCCFPSRWGRTRGCSAAPARA